MSPQCDMAHPSKDQVSFLYTVTRWGIDLGILVFNAGWASAVYRFYQASGFTISAPALAILHSKDMKRIYQARRACEPEIMKNRKKNTTRRKQREQQFVHQEGGEQYESDKYTTRSKPTKEKPVSGDSSTRKGPTCTFCKQPTKGHMKRYKTAMLCLNTGKSRQFPECTFDNFAEFKAFLDE